MNNYHNIINTINEKYDKQINLIQSLSSNIQNQKQEIFYIVGNDTEIHNQIIDKCNNLSLTICIIIDTNYIDKSNTLINEKISNILKILSHSEWKIFIGDPINIHTTNINNVLSIDKIQLVELSDVIKGNVTIYNLNSDSNKIYTCIPFFNSNHLALYENNKLLNDRINNFNVTQSLNYNNFIEYENSNSMMHQKNDICIDTIIREAYYYDKYGIINYKCMDLEINEILENKSIEKAMQWIHFIDLTENNDIVEMLIEKHNSGNLILNATGYIIWTKDLIKSTLEKYKSDNIYEFIKMHIGGTIKEITKESDIDITQISYPYKIPLKYIGIDEQIHRNSKFEDGWKLYFKNIERLGRYSGINNYDYIESYFDIADLKISDINERKKLSLTLNHLQIICNAYENGLQYICIAENDAQPNVPVIEDLSKYFNGFPLNWELIRLSYYIYGMNDETTINDAYTTGNYLLKSCEYNPWGTMFYLINRKFMRKIYNLYYCYSKNKLIIPRIYFNTSNIYSDNFLHNSKHNTNIYLYIIPFVNELINNTSSIGNCADRTEQFKKIFNLWNNYNNNLIFNNTKHNNKYLLFTSCDNSIDMIKNYFHDDKNYDVFTVNYYKYNSLINNKSDYCFMRKGFKFQHFYHFFKRNIEFFNRYQYIAIFDCDLIVNPQMINRMFDLSEKYNCCISAGELDNTSFNPYRNCILEKMKDEIYFVSFIEMNRPIFKTDALNHIIKHPLFYPHLIGWGSDILYHKYLDTYPNKMYILFCDILMHNPPTHLIKSKSINAVTTRENRYQQFIYSYRNIDLFINNAINIININVINLHYRVDRREHIVTNISKYNIFNIIFYNAIRIQQPEINCALSHLYILLNNHEMGNKMCTILEDDTTIDASVDKLKNIYNWLYAHLDDWTMFNGCPCLWTHFEHKIINNKMPLIEISNVSCANFVIYNLTKISKQQIIDMIDFYHNVKDFIYNKHAYDILMNIYFGKTITTHPYICYQEGFSSDIDNGLRNKKYFKKFDKMIENLLKK